jgi:hypothetical protein
MREGLVRPLEDRPGFVSHFLQASFLGLIDALTLCLPFVSGWLHRLFHGFGDNRHPS